MRNQSDINALENKTQFIHVENSETIISSNTIIESNIMLGSVEPPSLTTFINVNQLEIVEIPAGVTSVKCRTWGAGALGPDGGGGRIQ